MKISKTCLVVLVVSFLIAAIPNTSYPWATVFEVRAGHGILPRELTVQSVMDPQSTLTIGIEVMGVRIGYDSRYGLGALMEF